MRIRPVRGAAVLAVVLLALAGCKGATTAGGDDGDAAPSTTVAFGEASHGTVSDPQGNSVDIGVAIGPAQAAKDVPEAQACTAVFSSGSGQVAVPVQITETLHGSSPMTVRVDPSDLHGLTSDGGVSMPDVQVRWSVRFSDTPQECKGSGMSSPAVTWAAANPGTTNTFVAWMVLSTGVTASDPTGRDTAGTLVFNPVVSLGSFVGVPRFDPSGKQVVQCSATDPAMGGETYIGVDPDVAVHYGCTSPTAIDHIEAERDAVCNQQYPASQRSQTRVGSATVSNRAASLFQVCEGFGAGDVTFTADMSCAVVALAADQIGLGNAPDLAGAQNLCNTHTVLQAYRDGTWLKEGGKAACQFFGSVFADSLGVAAAGATVELGAAAVWVGVGTAHALSAGASLLCDGDLRDALTNFGAHLEADHEAHVARDVTHGKCLSNDPGAVLKKWSAVDCPS